MNKLKQFPSVNFISLENSFERRKHLYEQFAKYNVPNITPHIFKKFKDEQYKIEGKLIDKVLDSLLGAATSHILALKRWLETTTEPYGFFCEDDITLETVPYWNFTWDEFINSLPNDWDCVQLGLLQENLTEINFRRRHLFDWSLYAYVIKREYAEKIVAKHYNDGRFIFNVVEDNYPEYFIPAPAPENLIYLNKGNVYSFPLFVENIDFESACTPKNEHPGTYDHHKKIYLHILNWWKEVGCNLNLKEIITGIKEPKVSDNVFTKFAYNTEDPDLNFNLGLHYHEMNQTASAFSHYYRCAERTTDDTLKYECLLRSYMCFISQTGRDFTALHCLKQAVCLLPERPEAYFLLTKHYEDRKEWYECYTYSCISLSLCNFNLPPLRTWVGYPGKFALLFQKAISGWWWDKTDEACVILKQLLKDYPNLPESYTTTIKNNLKNFFKTPKYKITRPNNFCQTKNIVDCFSFFAGYGKEMLELRYHVLKDYVDYFVLTELNTTHTGTPIEPQAEKIIEELGLCKEKFIIINIELPPDNENLQILEIDKLNCMGGNHENNESLLSRVRERLQKDGVYQILEYFNDETVFIHSDLDEIINPIYIPWFVSETRKNSKIILKAPLVYLQGRADLRTYYKDTDTPAHWNDQLFFCLKTHLQNAKPTQIRSNKFTPYGNAFLTQNDKMVEDVGWHFSWMGKPEIKKIKQQSFIHYTDKFNFVVGGGYNNNQLEDILNNEILENQVPPSGEKDKVLKSYDINLLPKEIFKLLNVKEFLLPDTLKVNYLDNIQSVLSNIYGFCSVKKAKALTHLITKNKLQVIVEVGVLEGSSFLPQAIAVKQNGYGKIYAIDPWSRDESLTYTKDENHRYYWGTIDHDKFYHNFLNHLKTYNVEEFVEVLRGTSKSASQKFIPCSIDLIHIDGNHSEEQSYEDVQIYLPLIRHGGYILFDDVHWTDGGKNTTLKAVTYLQQYCNEIERITDELGNNFVIFQKK
jgi:GR25 family glycosyltransferase involved in LPS biosynthesis